MNCVVCLCVGQKYSDNYVHKLHSMVDTNTSVDHKFICFSDRYIPGIEVILIDDRHMLDPVWYKLWILQHPTLSKYDKKVFFDLDIIIQRNVDWLFDISADYLTIIRSDWKSNDIANIPGNTGYNSSVMVWKDAQYAWDVFNRHPNQYMIKYKGIDRFLWNEHIKVSLLPKNKIYSYREGASEIDTKPFEYRSSYDICIFNQYPKPHELADEMFIQQYWK